ncbi:MULTISPECIES: GntR family transcriptional regulator [Chromobacterium]|uniref:GntR family transcriptional regulator n=2 Tax=Chromobacterium TaxID=535 RepID=A0A1W0D945_9NEIS|nr:MULTISPECIES: GntR family transcriptional regulator [Chromobacterium]AXT48539.1 GntR family transcriptional regulator [Chromobacterium rhizoryzae]KMN82822.1 GntR family transcriptional regulator [Chromobacterium sp. LK11]MBK0412918.1 GntR family transcriptional regulator [Chromobacterium haemolyticum]MBO0414020.1 GntR family transcriptional regulator [Chromobacterium haemolyticum]MBO0497280.1 GntR family transcriptional regulator [Chromobacterium haemolyticum]
MENRWLALKPDETLTTPLYLQLSRKLADAINAGWWQADEALPSERTFSEELGISRVTARKAMDVLLEQGLIRRRQGSGTFITPRLEQPLSRLTGFTEQLRQRGFVPSSVWLERGVFAPSNEEVIKLGLSPTSQVSRLKRQRLADGVVMAIEMTTLPVAYLPEPQQVGTSLYAHLDASGHSVVRALQHIRAVNASGDIATLAGIRPGEAMLLITRIGFNAENIAIELTDTYCRNDYYDFVAELRR